MPLIDFDDAFLDPTDSTLTVKGRTPNSNVAVKLVPLVYIQTPPFWEIDVRGEQNSPFLTVLTPYTVTLDVTKTMGTFGVFVLGKHKVLELRRHRLSVKTYNECYVYCPQCQLSLSDCMYDRLTLAQIAGQHNIAQHNSQPVAKPFVCGSVTQVCDAPNVTSGT